MQCPPAEAESFINTVFSLSFKTCISIDIEKACGLHFTPQIPPVPPYLAYLENILLSSASVEARSLVYAKQKFPSFSIVSYAYMHTFVSPHCREDRGTDLQETVQTNSFNSHRKHVNKYQHLHSSMTPKWFVQSLTVNEHLARGTNSWILPDLLQNIIHSTSLSQFSSLKNGLDNMLHVFNCSFKLQFTVPESMSSRSEIV